MKTIYIKMEPQPELIRVSDDALGNWWFINNSAQSWKAPYKPGDEIDIPTPDGSKYQGVEIAWDKNYIVKSCVPVQRENLWQWKVEAE